MGKLATSKPANKPDVLPWTVGPHLRLLAICGECVFLVALWQVLLASGG